tara:strand:- start:296 stop:1267 length:972 start_codon:yes stop_codon:yes gene_type:complete
MVLTTPQIRKLIRAHNVLMSIKIPVGSKKADIIKIIELNGYEIDHEKKALIPKVKMKRKPVIDMKKAESVLPKPKTKEERATAKAKRDKDKQSKEKDLKQEGFKAGASLQRAVSKRQSRKKKEPVEPVEPDKPLAITDKPSEVNFAEIKKILKDSKYNFRKSESIKEGKLYMGTNENNIDKLIQDTDKLFKNNPLVYDNVVFMSNSYPPNPKTGEQDGVYRKPKTIYQGKLVSKIATKKASTEEIKVNKALRTRLNKDFKEKYGKSISEVLGFGTMSKSNPSMSEVKKECRTLKLKNHPDKGGDADVFTSIQEACDIYLETFR